MASACWKFKSTKSNWLLRKEVDKVLEKCHQVNKRRVSCSWQIFLLFYAVSSVWVEIEMEIGAAMAITRLKLRRNRDATERLPCAWGTITENCRARHQFTLKTALTTAYASLYVLLTHTHTHKVKLSPANESVHRLRLPDDIITLQMTHSVMRWIRSITMMSLYTLGLNVDTGGLSHLNVCHF